MGDGGVKTREEASVEGDEDGGSGRERERGSRAELDGLFLSCHAWRSKGRLAWRTMLGARRMDRLWGPLGTQ